MQIKVLKKRYPFPEGRTPLDSEMGGSQRSHGFRCLQGAAFQKGVDSTRSCPRQKTLAQEIKRLASEYPTFGYRRIWALLQREGYPCNQKTVYRAMKEMNLLQKTIHYEAKRSIGDRPADPTARTSDGIWT
ncbi:virulence-associated protein VapD [Kroppenstedtia sanguinis]|uniref:IS3 family transposase n=1 Tax=Kroppenstedtia sanguinis TaxID=1380684 RepID=A0ABW4CER7_9BACL